MAVALRVGIMSTAGIASKNFLAASAAPGVNAARTSAARPTHRGLTKG